MFLIYIQFLRIHLQNSLKTLIDRDKEDRRFVKQLLDPASYRFLTLNGYFLSQVQDKEPIELEITNIVRVAQ